MNGCKRPWSNSGMRPSPGPTRGCDLRPHEGQRLLPPAGQALDRPVPDDRRRETPPEHRGGLYAKVQPRLRLLAETDERHDTPSGPAVKKLCEGAWRLFGQSEYERLAQITVSPLYNFRKSVPCTPKRRHFAKTRPRQIPDRGECRKPAPTGAPDISASVPSTRGLGREKGRLSCERGR